MKRKTNYCKRTWLNSHDSPSTGSITCYAGDLERRDGWEPSYFIEIADCHNKVRLHMSCQDTLEEYTIKIKTMINTLNDYLNYLTK